MYMYRRVMPRSAVLATAFSLVLLSGGFAQDEETLDCHKHDGFERWFGGHYYEEESGVLISFEVEPLNGQIVRTIHRYDPSTDCMVIITVKDSSSGSGDDELFDVEDLLCGEEHFNINIDWTTEDHAVWAYNGDSDLQELCDPTIVAIPPREL